jgi:amino acid transporter
MVGSGIFTAPAEVAAQVRAPWHAVLLWALGAALTLLGALSLAELGAALPQTGGLYVYLRRAYGPRVAFVFGWAMLAVSVPSSVGWFAVVTAQQLQHFLPWGERPLALAVIAAVTLLNLLGVGLAAGVQAVTAALRYAGLGAVALVCAFGSPAPPAASMPHPLPGVSGIAGALVGVLWAYDGWIDVTSMASEVRDPARSVPRSLVLGVLAVAVLYLLVVLGVTRALGFEALQALGAGGGSLAAALGATLGVSWGAGVMTALVALSTSGACLIGMLTGTRVVYAAAQDVRLWAWLRAESRWGVPAAAVLVTALLASGYVVSAWMARLAQVFVVGAWPFYALGALAVVRLRAREPALPRPFRVPGYPWVVWLFVAASAAMLAGFALRQPGPTLGSLGLLALGVPLHALSQRLTGAEPGR